METTVYDYGFIAGILLFTVFVSVMSWTVTKIREGKNFWNGYFLSAVIGIVSVAMIVVRAKKAYGLDLAIASSIIFGIMWLLFTIVSGAYALRGNQDNHNDKLS